MKSIFIVKGFDCPNCAREFEEKVNKLDEVNECNLNFFTSKLIVDSDIDLTTTLNDLASNFEDEITLKRIK